ncbi:DUF4468 domain-containing protein [Gramella sp. AN32]|uniref:DUF4468 domain-containing protein n=1 Tax=Christiangramia antarctica TaxID=2058158 RepID=A0ABW5X922_9FLAO|nr:DUF4468 domain-containing protein [Gramella sp. AN32]MCM4158234.1 hypothetical protein [Gramella sp. AN32]
MKKMNLIYGILLIILTSINGHAQEYELEEKIVTGIFEVKDQNQSELFSSINKWISINYNSSKNVIQLNDKESGTIIIKGINEVSYANNMKSLYPNNKYMTDNLTTQFNHLIEINIKDNKYRIIYRITDIASEDAGYNDIVFKNVGFTGVNTESLNFYNEIIDENLKKGMIGEKKREKFKSLTKPMFEELNNNLLKDVKATMRSIEQSVKSESKDEW